MDMEVNVLRATAKPEQLVCEAGRGDYYEGYICDTHFGDIMSSVMYGEEHLDIAAQQCNDPSLADDIDAYRENDAVSYELGVEGAKVAFIQKQLRRGHYGLWEHPSITFAVKGVSRSLMAQITRHRQMSFDVQSMRYASLAKAGTVTPASITSGDHFSRETGLVELDEEVRSYWRNSYHYMTANAADLYEDMIEAGVPKEDARMVLPIGTRVNMTFTGNARTFLHLMDMRRKADAQWEIRQLSDMLLDELKEWMPYTFTYYEENGPNRLAP
jgi:thymidylate synthase (FAD)